MFFLQQLINGLTQGMIYALMAIGFSVIYGVVGLVSFVHGEIIMLGAFTGFFMISFLGSNLLFALIVGFIVTWILGMVVDSLAYRPFKNAPREIPLIMTIGLSIFLRSLTQVILGTQQRVIPNIFEGKYFVIGDIRITYIQIIIAVIVIALSLALQQFLYRTRTGLSLRAVSMDKDAAALVGVNVSKTIRTGYSLGCALGGVSGVLLGIYYNSVHPVMGASASMKAFASTVFGGLTSIPGAAIGGIVLGIAENLGVGYLHSGFRDIIAFVIIIAILLIRPSGIMGRKEGGKV